MPNPCRRFVSESTKKTGDRTYECVVSRTCSADYCPRKGRSKGPRVPGETRMIISDATREEAEGATRDIRNLTDRQLGKACDRERK